MDKKNKIFIGIDVSKATLDISISGRHTKIQNTKSAINKFIEAELTAVEVELCVLESTGGYERLVALLLTEADIRVHRAHPNKVHAFAKASGHFAKTDRLDSKLLEKYAVFIKDDKITEVKFSKELLELQSLRSVEIDLSDTLHAEQCREKMLIGEALKHKQKHIAFIKKELEAVVEEIEKIVMNNEKMRKKQELLISYKGVGKKTANALIADLPELGSMTHKEVASLIGVAPKTNESGKKIGKGHISGGRFYARKNLYMSALVASVRNKHMKIKYQEMLAKGKAAKVALTAIMRKIIVCLNAMIKENKLYEY